MTKDGSVLRVVPLETPTEGVKAVVALTQPEYLHTAHAQSE